MWVCVLSALAHQHLNLACTIIYSSATHRVAYSAVVVNDLGASSKCRLSLYVAELKILGAFTDMMKVLSRFSEYVVRIPCIFCRF